MKPKILVTGGAGFIGSHLVDAMVASDWQVVVIDDFSHGSRENLARHQADARVRIVAADVQDARAVETAARGCSVIVHLAALKIPRYGNRLGTLQVNATGTANVLAAAHHNRAEVVFASTSDCYGLNADVPFSETAHNVLGPSTIARWTYASSKLYSEHLCWAYHEEYGVPVTILRYFNSYGPREHRSWWGGPQAVFIEALLDNAPIELHGDGLQTRTFSYISDTVAGTMAALQNRAARGELINIGGTDEITIVDLAAMVQESFGSLTPLDARHIPYEQIASRPYQDSRRRKADLTKARRLLGFEPKVRLAEGLRHTIEWHRSVRTAVIA